MEDATRDEMNLLTVSNAERIQALGHKHIAVDVQQLMIRHLVETLFPTADERAELHFSFQRLLSAVLDEAEQRADQLVLQANAQPSGLLVPKH